VEAEWEVIDAILADTANRNPFVYAPGSWGPQEADAILLSTNNWKNE
jgi:glucose-6-phosphate 1-dehydrogenase